MRQTRARAADKEIKAIMAREMLQMSDAEDVDAVLERVQATPPKQARSLETVNRLLDAAEQLLEEEGLDAATVPAIAHRAGVSVGVVYRRFPDKDALLRAVWERFLARKREQSMTVLAACEGLNLPLPQLLRGVIRGSIEAHRRSRNLLRALLLFSRTHPDPKFKRSAHEMNRASLAAVTMLMVGQRERIDHPHPEAAIEFAMIAMASLIQAVILEAEGTHGFRAPVSLEEELTRMIFGYLGIDE